MYGSGSCHHQAKKVRKTMISTVLWLLYDNLSLKNDVNVPLKSNKQKNLLFFCWRLEGHWRKEQDPDPDPLVRGMDLRIRIRTKRSRILNTKGRDLLGSSQNVLSKKNEISNCSEQVPVHPGAFLHERPEVDTFNQGPCSQKKWRKTNRNDLGPLRLRYESILSIF